ncbi:MAG TPA: hypothetical protein VEH84_03520 [Alphaproteobacteria bacterium]|nr:hypothetical protein [Alphaproteobacteria bacterium]
MGVTKDILDALKSTIQLTDRVTGLAGQVKDLAKETRDLDRRLIRVETAMELATRSRFSAPPALPDDREG